MSSFFLSLTLGVLEGNYILCLGTFLAISDSELDFLAVRQSLEALAFDGAEMDEDIRAIFALDKAETLGLVKPFNSAGCCRHIYSTCIACGAMSRHLFI